MRKSFHHCNSHHVPSFGLPILPSLTIIKHHQPSFTIIHHYNPITIPLSSDDCPMIFLIFYPICSFFGAATQLLPLARRRWWTARAGGPSAARLAAGLHAVETAAAVPWRYGPWAG
jgi:hypothetical protein